MAGKQMFDPEILTHYDALIASVPGLDRKGAAMPYTSVNGHMFSFLDKAGALGLRLPEGERESFLVKHKTVLCEQHGTVLKEYVLVPDALFRNTKTLRPYFVAAYEYVSSLKPKPSKK